MTAPSRMPQTFHNDRKTLVNSLKRKPLSDKTNAGALNLHNDYSEKLQKLLLIEKEGAKADPQRQTDFTNLKFGPSKNLEICGTPPHFTNKNSADTSKDIDRENLTNFELPHIHITHGDPEMLDQVSGHKSPIETENTQNSPKSADTDEGCSIGESSNQLFQYRSGIQSEGIKQSNADSSAQIENPLINQPLDQTIQDTKLGKSHNTLPYNGENPEPFIGYGGYDPKQLTDQMLFLRSRDMNHMLTNNFSPSYNSITTIQPHMTGSRETTRDQPIFSGSQSVKYGSHSNPNKFNRTLNPLNSYTDQNTMIPSRKNEIKNHVMGETTDTRVKNALFQDRIEVSYDKYSTNASLENGRYLLINDVESDTYTEELQASRGRATKYNGLALYTDQKYKILTNSHQGTILQSFPGVDNDSIVKSQVNLASRTDSLVQGSCFNGPVKSLRSHKPLEMSTVSYQSNQNMGSDNDLNYNYHESSVGDIAKCFTEFIQDSTKPENPTTDTNRTAKQEPFKESSDNHLKLLRDEFNETPLFQTTVTRDRYMKVPPQTPGRMSSKINNGEDKENSIASSDLNFVGLESKIDPQLNDAHNPKNTYSQPCGCSIQNTDRKPKIDTENTSQKDPIDSSKPCSSGFRNANALNSRNIRLMNQKTAPSTNTDCKESQSNGKPDSWCSNSSKDRLEKVEGMVRFTNQQCSNYKVSENPELFGLKSGERDSELNNAIQNTSGNLITNDRSETHQNYDNYFHSTNNGCRYTYKNIIPDDCQENLKNSDKSLHPENNDLHNPVETIIQNPCQETCNGSERYPCPATTDVQRQNNDILPSTTPESPDIPHNNQLRDLLSEIRNLKLLQLEILEEKRNATALLESEVEKSKEFLGKQKRLEMIEIKKKVISILSNKNVQIENIVNQVNMNFEKYKKGCLEVVMRDRSKQKQILQQMLVHYEDLLQKYKKLVRKLYTKCQKDRTMAK